MKKAVLILVLMLSSLALRAGEDAVYRLDTQAGLSNNCVNDVLRVEPESVQ